MSEENNVAEPTAEVIEAPVVEATAPEATVAEPTNEPREARRGSRERNPNRDRGARSDDRASSSSAS